MQLERTKAATPSSSSVQPTVPLESPSQTLAPSAVPEPVESAVPTVQIAESVIHHHLLGSCTGRLKIDGERISFWSSGNSRDSFTRKIKQISHFSLDDKLLIDFKDKSYRFEALARDGKGGRERLVPFYEEIKLQKSPRAEDSVGQNEATVGASLHSCTNLQYFAFHTSNRTTASLNQNTRIKPFSGAGLVAYTTQSDLG